MSSSTYKMSGKRDIKINVIDETIIDCRLRGLNKSLQRGDYDRVKFNIIDTINHLNQCSVEMDKKLYNKIVDEFLHMRVESALRKYEILHNRIRDLHYTIVESYKN